MRDPGNAAADAADPLLGQLIDERYHVVRLLGRGGMGRVYEAVHVGIGKSVAVKVLAPGGAPVIGDRKRFEREAYATGRLDHPNCVTVSDFGALADGTLFLAMEMLRGDPLDRLIERERSLPVGRALHILRHMLRGLEHAHGRGVVHRDLTTRNVFLIEHLGDRDFAKVLDFGLAKLIGAAESGSGKLTAAGVTFGTPRYMSPEQILGKAVDHRTDIYAAAVILFELLAGRTPFVADDMQQVLMKHVTNPPPRLHEVLPSVDVPVDVELLIRRGLAKEPGERPQTATEFLAEVERLLGGAGTSLTPSIGSDMTVPVPDLTRPLKPRPVTPPPAPPPPTPPPTPPPRVPTPEPRALTPSHPGISPSYPGMPSAPRRRVWPWIAGLGAVAAIAVIAILAASSGGGDEPAPTGLASALNTDAAVAAPVPPRPPPPAEVDAGQVAAAPEVDAGAATPPPAEDIPELAEVDEMLRARQWYNAEKTLKKLEKKNPRSAGIRYRFGLIYYRRPWPEQAMRAYKAAIDLDPAYKHNGTLINHAIQTLTSTSAGWEARNLLLEIGEPAIPHLEKAARSDRSSVIRKYARQMLARMR